MDPLSPRPYAAISSLNRGPSKIKSAWAWVCYILCVQGVPTYFVDMQEFVQINSSPYSLPCNCSPSSAHNARVTNYSTNMPGLDEVSYSETATVTAINDFYRFLTNMYLDEETVEWPPEGGWPTLTKKAFGSMEKSERVISLLRQLPYMQDASDGEQRPQGLPEAPFWNWKDNVKDDEPLDPKAVNEVKILTEDFLCDITTPDLVGLLEGGRNENTVILLDTRYGIAYWPECPDEIKEETEQEQVQDDFEAWDSQEEVDWRCDAPAWTIPDFFAIIRDQFEQLRFIPVNSRQVIKTWSEDSDDDGMKEMLQEVYRDHGWPDLENHRKEECIEAVKEALAEQYPDFELY